ncbi:MAG: aminodeoxychorismate/anthranilate synthase component II [Marinilabiliales bacterium]|nr:MAG: aminodeoxychorismate/anthranilate synthase component II [Marinilabiliales bacterium]
MKRLLLLDNHDSYTFILRESLIKAGADQVDVVCVEDFHQDLIKDFDALVISPGPGIPEQNNLPEIIRNLAGMIPLLGICLGMQAIAEAFGGKIINMKQVYHGSEAIVNHSGTELFTDIPDQFSAGLYHSWAVVQESLPDDLKITSVSQNNVPMSLEHLKFPVCGFQFHPESHITKVGIQLLSNFLKFYV